MKPILAALAIATVVSPVCIAQVSAPPDIEQLSSFAWFSGYIDTRFKSCPEGIRYQYANDFPGASTDVEDWQAARVQVSVFRNWLRLSPADKLNGLVSKDLYQVRIPEMRPRQDGVWGTWFDYSKPVETWSVNVFKDRVEADVSNSITEKPNSFFANAVVACDGGAKPEPLQLDWEILP